MKNVVLLFRTVLDLLDFESVIQKETHKVDRNHLTVTGCFEEADIELAKAGYKAVAIEVTERL